ANLLRGGPDLAAAILDRLSMTEVREPKTLKISLAPIAADPLTQGWHLTGGDWTESRLVLRHGVAPPPSLSSPALVIDDLEYPLTILQRSASHLTCRVP